MLKVINICDVSFHGAVTTIFCVLLTASPWSKGEWGETECIFRARGQIQTFERLFFKVVVCLYLIFYVFHVFLLFLKKHDMLAALGQINIHDAAFMVRFIWNLTWYINYNLL